MDDHKVKAIILLKIGLLLSQVYQELCEDSRTFDKPLKKSPGTYEWDEVCDETFETFKGILVKALVLKLLDFDKAFEIHSDASNFAIGRVLVQDGRPVAFESKKLNDTK